METIKDLTTIASAACITSLQIAEATAKKHMHIMRDIRNLLEQGCAESNFGLGYYKDANKQQRPMYNLTKKGALILASGYSALLREKIINRLEELEFERIGLRGAQPSLVMKELYAAIENPIFVQMLEYQIEKFSANGSKAKKLEDELKREREMNEHLRKVNIHLMKSAENKAKEDSVYEEKRKRNSPTWKYVPEDFDDIKPGKTIGRVYPSLVVAKMAKAGCGAARFNRALAAIGIQRNTGKRGEWVILPPFDTLGIHRQIPLHGYSDYRRMGWTDKGVQFFKVLFGSDMDVLKAVKAVGGDTSLFQSFAKKSDGQEEDAAQQVINF